jgi:Ca2+-binding EF-hand superfamily protein
MLVFSTCVLRLFDDDNTNKISFRNLARVAEELAETIDDEELQDMINQADRDGDGEINIDEFYRIMMKKAGRENGEKIGFFSFWP